MALTIEDGTGIAGADSYMTVVEFKAYHDKRGNSYSTLGTTTALEKLLVKGTDYIEQRWGTLFKGSREFDLQPLSFPRKSLYDNDGDLVKLIPDKLKNSLAEYALRAGTIDLFLEPTVVASGMRTTLLREKVGPIEEETRSALGTPQTVKKFPAADRWLQEYVTSGGRAIRG